MERGLGEAALHRFTSILVHCSLFPVPCSLFPTTAAKSIVN
ncbi:hypothetical protein [Moorena producens]